MALSETTDALALPRPADDGSDPFDTTDLRTQLNTIDAQFDKGGDVASATSITVPDESYFDVTGTTTTAGFSTVNAGVMKMVQFDGALQLTHHSSSFNLPTGANITTAAGDRALFRSEGSGNWRCMWFQKATGAALKIADESIDSDAYVDGSIDAAHIASNAVTTVKINADAVTAAKIADDAIDSEHYTDGSIDAAHLASNAVTTVKINADAVTAAKIGDDVIDSEHYAAGSIDTAHIADNQVTLAKQADGTQGGIQYYGASGAPSELAAGTSGYFLKTQGASANPVWAAAGGGGLVQQLGPALATQHAQCVGVTARRRHRGAFDVDRGVSDEQQPQHPRVSRRRRLVARRHEAMRATLPVDVDAVVDEPRERGCGAAA